MEIDLKKISEFERALPVLEKIKEAGFEAYFVGGSVRDALLNLPVDDVDIATSAYPHEVKQIFKKTIDVGIDHGTVMVLYNDMSYEVTTFRTESTYQDFRRPDSVHFVRSLNEDLKRRDFTINTFAVDSDGKVQDYFNGKKDLDNQIIRAVGTPEERFREDALRMMRAVRFTSKLDFKIEKMTLQSIKNNAQLLSKISIERIQNEFEKLLLGKARSNGLQAMVKSELFQYCPGLKGKQTVLEQFSLDQKKIDKQSIAWTLLLFHLNQNEEIKPRKFLKSWKNSNKLIKDVESILDGIKKRIEYEIVNPWMLYTLGKELSMDVEVCMKHLGYPSKLEEVQNEYQALPIKSKDELTVSGHDLMSEFDRKPGKWLGDLLQVIEKRVVMGELENDKQQILEWIETSEH